MSSRYVMRTVLGVVALLALGGGVYAVFVDRADVLASPDAERAAAALEAGDLETALALYSELAAADPANPEIAEIVLSIRSRLARTTRQRERVYFDGEAWLRAFPERTSLRRLLIDVAVDLERYHDVLAHLDALERETGDPRFALLRARSLRALGRPHDAIVTLERATREQPGSIGVAVERADLLVETARWGEATAVMDGLGKRRPDDPAVLRARVRHAVRVEEFDEADRLSQRLVEVTGRSGEAVAVRAGLLVERFERARRHGKPVAALGFRDAARRLVGDGPVTDARVGLLRARFACEAGRFDEAATVFAEVGDHWPDDAAVRSARVEALLAVGEVMAANKVGDAIRSPALGGYTGGRLALADGRWSEAVASLTEARRWAAGDDRLVERIELALAECAARVGDDTGCYIALQRAVKANPRSASARLGLAAIAEDREDVEAALAEYRSLPLDPIAIDRTVRILVARNVRLPEITRDWTEVEELVLLAEVGATTPDVAATLRALLDDGRIGRVSATSTPGRRLDRWAPRYVRTAIAAARAELEVEPETPLRLSRP